MTAEFEEPKERTVIIKMKESEALLIKQILGASTDKELSIIFNTEDSLKAIYSVYNAFCDLF